MAGRILGDRYELGPVVGRGGMATVYRARDRVLHREVAVKVLQPQLARDQEFIERFRREARAAAGLSHPNIVGVHDHGSDGSDHFIVMEFVEGRTLAEVLDEEGALETGRAIAIATDVAAALSAAHERGLVHRDVKPANILLTDRGRVMVTDFGIARAATSQGLTMTGTVLGTASYLSPEQARGEPVDERSDVYSLGCVLYEMLTGEPPFAADSPVAVAALHVNADPPRPSAHQPGVPPQVEAAILAALAKDPAERPPNAEAFARSISGDEDATQVVTRRERTAVLPAAPADPEATAVRRDRRWLPMVLGALAIAILGFLLAGMLNADRDAEPARAEQRGEQPAQSPVGPDEEEPPPVLSVPEAYRAVGATIADASAARGITARAAEQVAKRVGEAMDRYQGGNLEEALAKLSEAKDRVTQRTEEGQIDPVWGGAIAQSIDTLELAMRQNPPDQIQDDDGGDDGDDSDGERGKGKGKGKDKD